MFCFLYAQTFGSSENSHFVQCIVFIGKANSVMNFDNIVHHSFFTVFEHDEHCTHDYTDCQTELKLYNLLREAFM